MRWARKFWTSATTTTGIRSRTARASHWSWWTGTPSPMPGVLSPIPAARRCRHLTNKRCGSGLRWPSRRTVRSGLCGWRARRSSKSAFFRTMGRASGRCNLRANRLPPRNGRCAPGLRALKCSPAAGANKPTTCALSTARPSPKGPCSSRRLNTLTAPRASAS